MKPNTRATLIAFITFWIAMAGQLRSENWPAWRGPRGDGSSTDPIAPVTWNAGHGQNIAWSVDIPGVGHSSPIIWGDCIFLTSCVTESQARQLHCLDVETGRTKWTSDVFTGPLESIHALNSRASGTPATNGKSIFVAFMMTDGEIISAPNVGTPRDITKGKMLVASYDLSGNKNWQVITGDFISAHGFSSCPVLHEDLVIVNGDHDGDSYIVGLDAATGRERWRRKRDHGVRSYSTPIVRRVGKRTQMVYSGSGQIVSLDPSDGSMHWMFDGPTEQMVASMVFDGARFYMNGGYPDHFVLSLRPDGNGDVTETALVWRSRKARSYVPSPVVVGGHLIVADDRGTANCFDTQTGDRLWQARLGKGYNASMVTANGLVYLTAVDGETVVLRPGRSVEIISRNTVGQDVSASPAISSGRLLIRGHRTLFCIQTIDNSD